MPDDKRNTFGMWMKDNVKLLLTFLILIVGIAIGFTQLTGRVFALERTDILRDAEVEIMKQRDTVHDERIRMLELATTTFEVRQNNTIDILKEVREDVKKILGGK